jgi:uncharacterized membrane protein YphA (DoxX/SURF4 family)
MIIINSKIYLVITLLTSLIFIIAGLTKLLGIEMMHDSFIKLSLPVWFGYFIGTCEILGAIGIQIEKLKFFASFGLTIIMIGAINFHISYDNDGIIPSIIIVGLCLIILLCKKK